MRQVSTSRLLRTYPTFSHSAMVSAVHAAGFCEAWYKNRQCLLSRRSGDGRVIRWLHDKVDIFQQDNELSYHLSYTSNSGAASWWVSRLHCSRHVAWPPHNRTLIRLITAFGEWCRNESTTHQYRTWQRLMSTWAGFQHCVVYESIDRWWMRLDARVRTHLKEIISNSCLTQFVECFTIAWNVFSRLHFWHHHIIVSCCNKTCRVVYLQFSGEVTGQNYKYCRLVACCQLASGCCTPNLIIIIGWRANELLKKNKNTNETQMWASAVCENSHCYTNHRGNVTAMLLVFG